MRCFCVVDCKELLDFSLVKLALEFLQFTLSDQLMGSYTVTKGFGALIWLKVESCGDGEFFCLNLNSLLGDEGLLLLYFDSVPVNFEWLLVLKEFLFILLNFNNSNVSAAVKDKLFLCYWKQF